LFSPVPFPYCHQIEYDDWNFIIRQVFPPASFRNNIIKKCHHLVHSFFLQFFTTHSLSVFTDQILTSPTRLIYFSRTDPSSHHAKKLNIAVQHFCERIIIIFSLNNTQTFFYIIICCGRRLIYYSLF
jgi:hypothetical protein